QPRLARRYEALATVPERDDPARLEVEIGQSPPGPRGAGRDVIEEHARVIGHERGTEPAVGDLARHLETPRRQGREIDRYVGLRSCGGSERLALAARQRQRVDRARVFQPLAPDGAADDLGR